MTNKEESRQGMYKDSNGCVRENMELLKELPEMVKNSDELQKNIENIDRIAQVQNFDKRGFALEKKQRRETLILLTNDNSKKIEAYAKLENKIVLAKEAKFTKSKMVEASDIIVYEYGQMVYDKAQENIDSLGPFGITAETQNNLQNAINEYKESVSKPRLGQKEKKEATNELKRLFKESDDLLERMDAVIYIIRDKQPALYNRYMELRKVVVTGTGSLAMKAAAVEMPSGIPLKGVKFNFSPENPTMGNVGNGNLVKKTADKGTFYIKNLAEGTYRIRVSKIGYKDKELKVNIIPGEMLDLEVEMEKV